VAGAAPVESPHRKPNGVPQFWYGTKYLKVMIRNRDREGGTLLCDDLKIEMRQVP